MTSWKVTRDWRASMPGEGPPITVELTGGTTIAEADLDGLMDGRRMLAAVPSDNGSSPTMRRWGGADLAAWINRDAPGTLQPSDDPPDATPVRHVPGFLLAGMRRRGAG